LACAILALAISSGSNATAKDAIDDAINSVLAVEKNGQGHAAAAKAMQTLRSATKADIPRLLRAMDKANQISANWLRGVIVATTQRDGELPIQEITGYFTDDSHSQLGRLMAFELLDENDPSFGETTIPTLVDDASLPLRRMAIEWHINKAKDLDDSTAALGILGTALNQARDIDQVSQIGAMMKEKGISINMQDQLGFIKRWHIVGSFDNKDEGGFDVAHGPEKDLQAISLLEDSYENTDQKETKWFAHSTVDPMGLVDLTKAIGPIKGVTAYAYATFTAEEAREVDFRLGCINAHKVWVNGELTISNEVYHNGISPDKFAGQANLKEGENIIVLKICQNEQTQPWAQKWEFQLRVCDETGKAIKQAEVEPEGF
jgi:hypothetical protein